MFFYYSEPKYVPSNGCSTWLDPKATRSDKICYGLRLNDEANLEDYWSVAYSNRRCIDSGYHFGTINDFCVQNDKALSIGIEIWLFICIQTFKFWRTFKLDPISDASVAHRVSIRYLRSQTWPETSTTPNAPNAWRKMIHHPSSEEHSVLLKSWLLGFSYIWRLRFALTHHRDFIVFDNTLGVCISSSL